MPTNGRAQSEATSNSRAIGLALATFFFALGAGLLVLLDSTAIDAQGELATVGLADATGSFVYVDTESASPGSIKLQAIGNDPTPNATQFQHLAVTLTNQRPRNFFNRSPEESLALSSSPSTATEAAPWMVGNSFVLSGQFDYLEGGDKWLCLSVNSQVVECQEISLPPADSAGVRSVLEDLDGDMRFTHASEPFSRDPGDDLCPLEYGANESGCPIEEAVEQSAPTAEETAGVETPLEAVTSQAEAAPARATCNGLVVTVNIGKGEAPTSRSDVILGTPGDDVIFALGGNDVICALGGNDTIAGGKGADTLLGGAGNDDITGGEGDDLLLGAAGNDVIRGLKGHDELSGADGDDSISGGEGHDIISGGDGSDTIFGGRGNDQIVSDEDDVVDDGGP